MTPQVTAHVAAETGILGKTVFSGTWFVTRSSLPLWHSWNNPSVTYTPLPGGQILDTVRPARGRQTRLIVGVATPCSGAAGAFEWRGLSPLTRLVRSRWQVIVHDPAGQEWAVTVLARTPFTPAGLDIYTRHPYLLPDVEGALLRLLCPLPAAAPYLPSLFAPVHDV